jgi:hypothetical protein
VLTSNGELFKSCLFYMDVENGIGLIFWVIIAINRRS